MSTALSSTRTHRVAQPITLRRRLLDPVTDLRALFAFRSSGMTSRSRLRLRVAGLVVLALTLAAAVVPALVSKANGHRGAGTIVALGPTVYLGFLVLAVITAAASGGGREVVPRDQAVAYPISSTTDHLGALLLAPLNIAWLMEAWAVLGTTSYVLLQPSDLPLVQLPVVLFIISATALGQVVGWTLEYVRRGPHGTAVVRGLTGALAAVVGALAVTHHLVPLLDRSPTGAIYLTALQGGEPAWTSYGLPVLGLAAAAIGLILLGALPAAWAARRAPRDEHRLESGNYPARANPAADLWALVRIDRAGVWRSVPLRRGLVVLAVMPGLIALGGQLEWSRLTILPGLVASGAALLFGVNAWALDGRGGLWRESLPYSPGLAFGSRVWVLSEILLGTALLTVVLGTIRAGVPTLSEVVALLGATSAVTAMVVSASMRWSIKRPFAVDLKSARATPAPPVVMVGYSTRLALATTVVGLIFSGLAEIDDWWFSVLFALLFVLVSAYRTARAASRWADRPTRARVVVTVAG